MLTVNDLEESQIARRKLRAPDDFVFFRLERIGPDGILVTGGVLGPHGRIRKNGRECIVVTDAEVEAFRKEQEAATGRCALCRGTGTLLAKTACWRCKGTGAPC